MQLIGVLGSPYVRRIAICFSRMGIIFERRPLSVFSSFEDFKAINPVVKAPSLICDDGSVLMDSTLILAYGEMLVPPERSLIPPDIIGKQRALILLGLALAACEKSVQIVYEHNQRPMEKRHQPWIDRVQSQATAAFRLLEDELCITPLAAGESQASITTAVVWQFAKSAVADIFSVAEFPLLQELSRQSELLPDFLRYPPKDPVVQK